MRIRASSDGRGCNSATVKASGAWEVGDADGVVQVAAAGRDSGTARTRTFDRVAELMATTLPPEHRNDAGGGANCG